jgi:hypothetical protein
MKVDRLGRPDARQYSAKQLSAADALLEQVAQNLKEESKQSTAGNVSAR